jgi:hypothetical protein
MVYPPTDRTRTRRGMVRRSVPVPTTAFHAAAHSRLNQPDNDKSDTGTDQAQDWREFGDTGHNQPQSGDLNKSGDPSAHDSTSHQTEMVATAHRVG